MSVQSDLTSVRLCPRYSYDNRTSNHELITHTYGRGSRKYNHCRNRLPCHNCLELDHGWDDYSLFHLVNDRPPLQRKNPSSSFCYVPLYQPYLISSNDYVLYKIKSFLFPSFFRFIYRLSMFFHESLSTLYVQISFIIDQCIWIHDPTRLETNHNSTTNREKVVRLIGNLLVITVFTIQE